MKWNRTFGFCSRNSSTALVLWADRLSSTMWISLAQRAFLYQLPKEDKKLCAGVPFCSLAFHFAGLHIQGGIERERPMAVILEPMAFRSPRR